LSILTNRSALVAAAILMSLPLQHPAQAQVTSTPAPPSPQQAIPVEPDPLIMDNGKRVSSVKQWRDKRRAEIISLFSREMYGQMPPKPANETFVVTDNTANALNGKAIRRQVSIFVTGNPNGPRIDLLMYLPNHAAKPVPVILGLNFSGNHAVTSDPGVIVSRSAAAKANRNNQTNIVRGSNANQWPIEEIISRGYGVATADHSDIDADSATSFATSVRALYPELQSRGDNFSTVAAWAWGLSRCMDYLVTDKDVAAKHVAVFGFSRLGKAAVWAGATDERFAMVISNESGAGGAKAFRRGAGESITRLNTVFPWWFCTNFRKYNGQDTTLPFDQDEVLALIAPRPLYVASAEEDKNSDPMGEFLDAKAVDPVYRFLGARDGLPALQQPPVNQSVQGQIAYHVRSGGHSVTEYDWQQYLAFADKNL